MNRLLLLLLVAVGTANAGTQTTTTFVAEGTYIGGSAYVQPPVGGDYVYGNQPADSRPRVKPFLMGPIPRQSYTFFSAEEERLLLSVRDKALAQQIKETVVTSRKAHFKKTKKLDWPKVVLQADSVCVPVLASVDAIDWQDHLTCYNVAGAN